MMQSISDVWKLGGVRHDWEKYMDSFWFWTLGAYEVTRTMDQHSAACFSNRLQKNIKTQKKILVELRVPFAKQEYAGEGRKGSLSSLTSARLHGDFGFGYIIKGERYLSNDVVASFSNFIDSIEDCDIISHMPQREPHEKD